MIESVVRCSRCILPESYPNLELDQAGVCRVCREFDYKYRDINWAAREKKLQRILKRYRGKGRKYDVLVPFSGGKESTYTLLMMKEKYRMRCLAFNVDNGFLDPGALAFMKRSAAKLGVDLVTYSPGKELLNRVYAHALQETGEFCAACVVLIPTAIFRAADAYGIRLIAAGFSDMLESPPPETSYMDRVCFKNIMKSQFSMKELKWDYLFPSWKRMFKVKQINLPDYIPWDLQSIYETLNRELDFGKTVADARYDCTATPYSSWLFRQRTGFGKYEYLYANLVRAGVLKREKALEIVRERDAEDEPANLDNFLKGIGCDRSVLENIHSRSVFNFRTRNRVVRNLAIRLRELLP